jgi:hypothetical protein
LRAEFNKAAKLRVWLFVVQLAVAVPAAAAVLVTNSVWVYVLAVTGVLLLVAWWALNSLYSAAREAAHSARRAALLAGGLSEKFSADEIRRLCS